MARVVLQVIYHDTGRIEVAGNVDHKLLCYAALEGAKDLIRDFHNEAVKPPTFGSGLPMRLESEPEQVVAPPPGPKVKMS